MLSRLDDYPIHQTQAPVAKPATTDRNFYDRYWFNGFQREGGFYFGAGLGLYPNRRVMDAAFSFVKDGVQHSLHASRLAPDDPSETRVGPLRIEVIQPMRELRIVIEPNETGIAAELRFRARSACLEEERAPMVRDRRLVMDTTRFTQFGRWDGWLEAGGQRQPIDAREVLATRDRSWGLRPVGEPAGGRPAGDPQLFFFWAPLQFDDCATHAATFETSDGQPFDNFAWIAPLHAASEALPGVLDPAAQRLLGVRHHIEWRPGTRWARAAELELLRPAGEPERIRVEPLLRFQMLGIGYLHPEWGHGVWKGDSALAGESWKVDELNPLLPQHLHVQQVVRAEWGKRRGVGVLEQIVLGPYPRYGFRELFDGAHG
jgi:hypothetical protein